MKLSSKGLNVRVSTIRNCRSKTNYALLEGALRGCERFEKDSARECERVAKHSGATKKRRTVRTTERKRERVQKGEVVASFVSLFTAWTNVSIARNVSNECFRSSLLILLFVAPDAAAINPSAPRRFARARGINNASANNDSFCNEVLASASRDWEIEKWWLGRVRWEIRRKGGGKIASEKGKQASVAATIKIAVWRGQVRFPGVVATTLIRRSEIACPFGRETFSRAERAQLA